MMKLLKYAGCALVASIFMFQAGFAASGTTKVKLEEITLVAGSSLQPGDYTVSWRSQSPDATVTFFDKDGLAVEVKATLVERDQRSSYDSVLSVPDKKGRLVLKEIRFRGKKFVLVFE